MRQACSPAPQASGSRGPTGPRPNVASLPLQWFQMVLMRLRLCIGIILCAWLAMPMSQALAQRPDIGDQPGHIPDAADEDLPAPLRRQLVFYRSTEAPGTIIVHTSEKFLYVVQPNGR